MEHLADNFINLPIIISDYDAILAASPTRSTFSQTSLSSSPSPSTILCPHQQNAAQPDQQSQQQQATRKPPNPDLSTSTSTSSAAPTLPSTLSLDQAQRWTTGFADFADELFNKMTSGMRDRLREACVEVLRRTDDPSEEERMMGGWDEDARFLE